MQSFWLPLPGLEPYCALAFCLLSCYPGLPPKSSWGTRCYCWGLLHYFKLKLVCGLFNVLWISVTNNSQQVLPPGLLQFKTLNDRSHASSPIQRGADWFGNMYIFWIDWNSCRLEVHNEDVKLALHLNLQATFRAEQKLSLLFLITTGETASRHLSFFERFPLQQ